MTQQASHDLLASFVALAEELHFTRAAERLHVAQPALTKRIQQLERMLDVPLVSRTRRSVRLTAAGDLLLPRARQALHSSTDFHAAAARIRDGELGLVRIGFSPSAPHLVLPTLMRAFRRRHPGLECVLTELPSDVQVDQILAGDLDAGILRRPAIVPPRLACSTFLEEPFVVVLPRDHRLARRRSLAIAELVDEPLVLIARRVVAALHDQVLGACAAAGYLPRALHEATHVHAVVSLVAAGCGVSVLPASSARVGIDDVVCVPLGRPALRTVMAVAHLRKGAPSAVATLVRAAGRRREVVTG